MPIPLRIEWIGTNIKNAQVTQDHRVELADYLQTVNSNDELFLKRIKRSIRQLLRFNEKDVRELSKWLPIVMSKLNDT